MTAIAGVVFSEGRGIDQDCLRAMNSALAPYGRDGQNQWVGNGVFLLRTLLRTTPEDAFDQQPVVHDGAGVVLVFDGRIDNRDELIRAIGFDARRAASMSDSEIVLRGYLKWGLDAPAHFVGDFAFACFDIESRRLVLARSPLGLRPLFWFSDGNVVAFASMPKAIFRLPGFRVAVCEKRLHEFVCNQPQVDSNTFFVGIHRVEPGQMVLFERGVIDFRIFHSFAESRLIEYGSDREYVEAFSEQLERAVECRLRANGEIATELSSGYDSSTVTAIAALLMKKRGAGIRAYTAVPREGYASPVPSGWHGDESVGARALCAGLGNVEHVLIRSDETTILGGLADYIASSDRAPLNACNSAWARVLQSRVCADGARVLLSGAVGNLSTSHEGYTYLSTLLGKMQVFAWLREAGAIRRRHASATWSTLIKMSVAPYTHRLASLFGKEPWGLADYDKDRDFTESSPVSIDFHHRMTKLNWRHGAPMAQLAGPWADGRSQRIALLKVIDIGEFSAHSNSLGLDVRDPTADARLVEFCLGIPESLFLRNGKTRWILHQALGNVLPVEITEKRTKGLQAADWHEVLSRELASVKLALLKMNASSSIRGFIDVDSLIADAERWPLAGFERPEVLRRYRYRMLRGLAAGLFLQYIDGE